MIPRLLLFDGPPGAGKSSLSQFLAEQLQQNQYDTRWIAEETLDGTFFQPFMTAFEQRDPDIADILLVCWQKLVQEASTKDIIFIIDGAFFANSIKFLFANAIPLKVIEQVNQQVYELLHPLAPWLIYVKGDTEKIVRRAIAYRGSQWETLITDMVREYPYQQAQKRTDSNGMIQFFVDSYMLFEDILRTCPLRQITFDTMAGDWNAYQATLLKECGCTETIIPSVLNNEQRKSYVGVYHPPDFFPELYRHPIVIEEQDNGLVVHFSILKNLLLLPRSKTLFAIRGRSEHLEFILDAQEHITGIVYPFVTETRYICQKGS